MRGLWPKDSLTCGCIASTNIFKFIPWDQLGQLDPAVIASEFSSKRQEEVFKRELVTMSTSVHVENSERLLGVFGPIRVHSTAENCSNPLCRRRSSLFQETLGSQGDELAAELVVLLPESLNLLLLNEDQRSDAGWCCQPIRFWNPGRRAAHHRRSLPVMQPGIKLPSRVQQGWSSR